MVFQEFRIIQMSLVLIKGNEFLQSGDFQLCQWNILYFSLRKVVVGWVRYFIGCSCKEDGKEVEVII